MLYLIYLISDFIVYLHCCTYTITDYIKYTYNQSITLLLS